MTTPRRSEREVLRELAELRRHLDSSPPHHGEGRHHLEERLRRAERELARLRGRSSPGTHPPRPRD